MIPILIYIVCLVAIAINIFMYFMHMSEVKWAIFRLEQKIARDRARLSAALAILFGLVAAATYLVTEVIGFRLPSIPVKIETSSIWVFVLAVTTLVAILVLNVQTRETSRSKSGSESIERVPDGARSVIVTLLIQITAAVIAGLILAYIFNIR